MKDFHERLRLYFHQVAKVMKGQADAANIFRNPTDKGGSREEVFASFLKQHAPSKCNVVLGGYLFHQEGMESRQQDVLVTCDVAPRYDLFSKTFAPVEGTLCVVSVKSSLSSAELEDALHGFASIPPTEPLGARANPMLPIRDYEDWPLKVLFASATSVKPETLHTRLTEFYEKNPSIPVTRRPHFIHVLDTCLIARLTSEFHAASPEGTKQMQQGCYFRVEGERMDAGALIWLVHELQRRAAEATQIHFRYDTLLNHVMQQV